MEAAAAFSLAANVLQVVELAGKLLSAGHQVYQAGTTVQNAELEIAAKDFKLLNSRLSSWARPSPGTLGPLDEDSQSLETLALESGKIAQELIDVLTSLRAAEKASRFESFLKAIESVWKSKKIAETKRRLDEIQNALQFRILMSMKNDQNSMQAALVQSLDDVNRKTIEAVLQGTDSLIKLQEASNALSIAHHNQILNIVQTKWDPPVAPADVLDHIKARLYHPGQEDRYDDIAEAHRTTFRWALQKDELPDQSWPSLYKWLCEDHGVYWVSGKAASGKSTLMKCIHQDPAFRSALAAWAGSTPLIIVSFFFWNPGTDLQKSQEGLFRTILYQVLDQQPSLGQVLFPEQYMTGTNWTDFPTSHQVRRAFSRFRSSIDGGTKIAMLIDGLDEFEDIKLTTPELADMFITATQVPNVKALLSSRPLAPFEFAFNQSPKLRLHDLTHDDITSYVDEKLARHPRVADLMIENRSGVQQLIAEIVDSASGVFLWVKLVVRSLLEGVANYDPLPDLQERLRELPQDLEELFQHMLRKVPIQYKTECSQYFQILRCHSDLIDSILTAIVLHFSRIDQAMALSAPIQPLSDLERSKVEDHVAGRLRSCCAGLLEVRIRSVGSDGFKSFPIRAAAIQYLHKSVADFIFQEEVWAGILQHTKQTGFDPSVALLRSTVRVIKLTEPDLGAEMLSWLGVHCAMRYAKVAERATTYTETMSLLAELDRSMTIHFEAGRTMEAQAALDSAAGGKVETWYDCAAYYTGGERRYPWHDNLLGFATRLGLGRYVKSKVQELGSGCIHKPGRPLLDYAYGHWCEHIIRVDIVEKLLQHDADPNEAWGEKGNTVWCNALETNDEKPLMWIVIVGLFVQYGADVHVSVASHPDSGDARAGVEIRQSALRYIKQRVEACTRPGLLKFWSINLDTDRSMPTPSQFAELRTKADEVIELLVAKGAKEEEWQSVRGGPFKQVYPKQSSPSATELLLANEVEDEEPEPVDGGPSKQSHAAQSSKSTSNPIKRLAKRLTRTKHESA